MYNPVPGLAIQPLRDNMPGSFYLGMDDRFPNPIKAFYGK
ncbi:hypothetical protein CJA_0507 [Cellvibrio japonicus Ueda107]|uniref:Uncharacterized protein n=1 Tax=Cellvibrio japonicus (strain Ueda107) TaxID=498211 RepID=B3PIZ6_CELJU|nr:hypothetical protein CJA_0507 [Cellvibrio japonicus Ueda107]